MLKDGIAKFLSARLVANQLTCMSMDAEHTFARNSKVVVTQQELYLTRGKICTACIEECLWVEEKVVMESNCFNPVHNRPYLLYSLEPSPAPQHRSSLLLFQLNFAPGCSSGKSGYPGLV
jgi:hypothetical protein